MTADTAPLSDARPLLTPEQFAQKWRKKIATLQPHLDDERLAMLNETLASGIEAVYEANQQAADDPKEARKLQKQASTLLSVMVRKMSNRANANQLLHALEQSHSATIAHAKQEEKGLSRMASRIENANIGQMQIAASLMKMLPFMKTMGKMVDSIANLEMQITALTGKQQLTPAIAGMLRKMDGKLQKSNIDLKPLANCVDNYSHLPGAKAVREILINFSTQPADAPSMPNNKPKNTRQNTLA